MKVLEGSEKLYDNGVVSTTQYKIAQSAKVMDMLSNRLYKDKVKAVIRELSTNAWDAHVESGNTNKVPEIKLPNYNDSTFSIRDFGTGLSPEKLEEMYTTYGESTKTHSNAYNGCMGIGSKSPFAYCRSFTTTSFYNGKKYVYINAKDASNMPTLRKVGEYETDEPNGLLIQFATETSDLSDFEYKAQEILKWFPKPFKVVGRYGTTLDITNKTEYAYEGNSGVWKIRDCRNDYDYESHVIMGYIRYPIDRTQFAKIDKEDNSHKPTGVDDDWYQYYQKIDKVEDGVVVNYEEILNCGFEFSVPIGDIEMDISREGLQYSPATVKRLKELMDEAITEVSDVISDKISNASSLYEARIEYHKVSNDSELSRIANNLKPSWNGKEFKPQKNIKVKNYEQLRRYGFNTAYKFALKTYGSYDHDHVTISSYDRNIFVEDDMGKGAIAAMRRYVEGKLSTLSSGAYSVFLVSFKDDVERQSFIDQIGINDSLLMKASSVPKAPRKKRTAVKNYQVFEYVNGSWQDTNIAVDDGGYYVELNNWHAFDANCNKYHGGTFERMIRLLKSFATATGLDIPQIVGVKTKSKPKFEKHKKWHCFIQWIKDEVQSHIDGLDIDDQIPIMLEYQKHKGNNSYRDTDLVKFVNFVSQNKEFNKTVGDKKSFENLVDKYQEYGIIYKDTEAKIRNVSDLAQAVSVETTFGKYGADKVLSSMYDDLLDKYYIFQLISTYAWDSKASLISDFVNMVNERNV